jgi:enoyl-[acyl-carrier-protein] reductase (NADH)
MICLSEDWNGRWERRNSAENHCDRWAAFGIPGFDWLFDKVKAKAPAQSFFSIDDVGVATAFLALDAARLITGETPYIDTSSTDGAARRQIAKAR